MSFLLNLPWLASPLLMNIVCRAIEHQASTTSTGSLETTGSILFHMTFYPISTDNEVYANVLDFNSQSALHQRCQTPGALKGHRKPCLVDFEDLSRLR